MRGWTRDDAPVLFNGATLEIEARVWKDPKRDGFRGAWRHVEWFFMPSAEATMRAIDREIVDRRRS